MGNELDHASIVHFDELIVVRYCTVFSFIVLLYCESYIYISPICNVEIRLIILWK